MTSPSSVTSRETVVCTTSCPSSLSAWTSSAWVESARSWTRRRIAAWRSRRFTLRAPFRSSSSACATSSAVTTRGGVSRRTSGPAERTSSPCVAAGIDDAGRRDGRARPRRASPGRAPNEPRAMPSRPGRELRSTLTHVCEELLVDRLDDCAPPQRRRSGCRRTSSRDHRARSRAPRARPRGAHQWAGRWRGSWRA